MKTKFFVLALITTLSITSQAQSLFGYYKKTTSVDHSQVGADGPNAQFRQYYSQDECRNHEGQVVEDSTGFLCRLEAQDDINVLRSESGDALIKIKKVAIGGHICSYEAPARKVSENVLVSESEGCRVTLNFNRDQVSVLASDSCSLFCGAGLDLNISSAVKQ